MKDLIIKSLFEDDYIHSPLMFKLVKNNKLDYYIKKLESEEYYVKFGKNKIINYKHFLMMLDNFIDYLDCSLNINHSILKNILDIIFKDQKNNIFLTKYCIRGNRNIYNVTNEYKKMILSPFKNNLIYVLDNNDELKNYFKVFKIDINDNNELFNFLIDCCNARKNHQYLLFDDFNEYIKSNIVFYNYMWKILFEKLKNRYVFND